MGSVIYFWYTMLVLAICFGTLCIAGFAYASSGRKVLLWLAALFLVYTFETAWVFFNEFANEGALTSTQGYYSIQFLWLRTVLGTAAQACTQLAAAAILRISTGSEPRSSAAPSSWRASSRGRSSRRAAFSSSSTTPCGRSASPGPRLSRSFLPVDRGPGAAREARQVPDPYFAIWALLACVVAEDLLVTMFVNIEDHPSWIVLFLSERNFSENILAGYMAFLAVRYALHLLSVRMQKAPKLEEVDDLEERVNEQMEVFASSCGLSAREAEVLALVIQGSSNHEIATKLFLAEGTVKKHVHNIMVKTGTKSREALTLRFWRG